MRIKEFDLCLKGAEVMDDGELFVYPKGSWGEEFVRFSIPTDESSHWIGKNVHVTVTVDDDRATVGGESGDDNE